MATYDSRALRRPTRTDRSAARRRSGNRRGKNLASERVVRRHFPSHIPNERRSIAAREIDARDRAARNRRCAYGAQFPRVFTATACVSDCRSPCRSKLCAFTNLNNPRENIMTNQAMSYSISTLLTRNLQDGFGENDPARRRAAIDEIWTEDGVFYDPKTGVHRGRDEIDRIAGAIKATHPDFQYQPIAEPEELGNGGRVKWVAGRPGEPPAYAGTDFIIVRDGRIAALYLFFD